VLIALLVGAIAALLVGASGGSDIFEQMLRFWRRAIRRHVHDRARREAGEAKLEEFEREAAVLVASLHAWMDSFGRVHRRYESTLADYDRLADVLVEEVYTAQVRLLDVADELRQAIGEQAWSEITEEVERGLRKAREAHEKKQADKSRGRAHCRG